MTESYLQRKIGRATPYVLNPRGITFEARLAALREVAVDIPKPPRPNWVKPLVMPKLPGALVTSWVQFEAKRLPGIADVQHDDMPVGVADLPLDSKGTNRLLLVGAGDKKEAGVALNEYLNTVGNRQQDVRQVPITDTALKSFFEHTEYYDSINAISGTEHSVQTQYEGDTLVSSNSPKNCDVRYSSKLQTMLTEPWNMLRLVPSQQLFTGPTVPPPLELRTDGQTIRSWRHWHEPWALALIRDVCLKLLELEGTQPDADRIEEAARPPARIQAKLF